MFAQALQPHRPVSPGCRAWNIGKKGELSEAGAREKAHKDRVTAILWHKNFLYSVSYDGCIKMWDGTNLELVMEVKKAHDGQRIQCGAIAPDGFLYTGGDDKASTWYLMQRNFAAMTLCVEWVCLLEGWCLLNGRRLVNAAGVCVCVFVSVSVMCNADCATLSL